MKKRSFVFGTLILAVSGIVCKVLGAVYKIPLTNILGTQGMGVYYFVFPIYAFLLTLSSTSLPVAISTMVSKCVANEEYGKAQKIFKSAFLLLLFLGIFFTCLLLLLAGPLAALQGNSEARLGYITVAPAILIVALICAYRGYFQGLQNMVPSAVSQIIEQLFKLFAGLFLTKILLPYGLIYGVLGALLSITISELFSLIYLVIHYAIFKKKHQTLFVKTDDNTKTLPLILTVLKTSLPYILGSILFPLALIVDSFLIVNILIKRGFSPAVATSLFGINVSIISTLVSLPGVLSAAVAMAIVPAIVHAKTKGDEVKVKSNISLSVKLSLLVLLPCSIIFLFFAPDVLYVLFKGGLTGGEYNQLAVASTALRLASFNVLFLGLLQVFTAILQGLNKPYVPVVSLSAAIVVKVISEIIMLNINQLNILGAVLSNALCFFVAVLINLIYLKKHISFELGYKKTFFVPIAACLFMVLTVWCAVMFLPALFGKTAAVLVAFVLGGAVYLGTLILLKSITKEERQFFKLR